MSVLRVVGWTCLAVSCLGFVAAANAEDAATATTPQVTPGAPAAAASDSPATVPFPLSPTPEPAAAAATTAPVTKAGVTNLNIAADSDERLFPRYAILKPNVAFWTRVFAEYSENQSVLHVSDHPEIVFQVLDFSDEAARLDEQSLRRLRNREENEARERIEAALKRVHEARHSPETLQGEDHRVFALFAGIDDDNRFKNAIGTVRAQRGLKERTQQALETAGKYLPAMEGVFRSYALPLRLTRLPLVESSFNVEAYSKVGAAGLWQFIPSSARIYMRLNEVVDDRRDPWASTDAAARHLRDDYAALGSWPLALTAYNHGRAGIARGLAQTGGTELPDLIRGYQSKSFGFASRNFYAEFLAASDVERQWKQHFGDLQRKAPLQFDVVETRHYVPYETLRRLCDADDEVFRKLNPAYRPEVIQGKLYVPPGHLIRVPAGRAKTFEIAYASLGSKERFDRQRVNYVMYRVQKGDSLSRIAHRHGVSQASIRDGNGLGKKGMVRIGQVLKIVPAGESLPGPVSVALDDSTSGPTRTAKKSDAPAGSKAKTASRKASRAGFRTHKVRSGQTLSSIASLYRVSIKQLRVANDLGNSSHIRAGEKIKVPLSQ